ncbi:hypothetical protein [Candidatus Mycolicibacterium alkanivorans]|uniref:Uncharacterized protein n=1 Tax=Candidatus Mycolicibacterium alkanivorans TaxID=2954114 RepID=A0ABS9YQU0_9MYCO|nr:hypothetical protein [Candidatus Mycolicibacterium alkanivorans]MCI4673617.1 hypothetical protein [Candidatus Mycolicibacterium alkanivorans]
MAQLMTARRIKLALAVLGGAAVVTMTGLSVVTGGSTTTDLPPAAAPLLPGPMTQGDTVTTTIPPSTLAVKKAAPPVKAKPYGKG